MMPVMPPEGLEDGSRSIVIRGGEERRSCFTPSARDVAGNVTTLAEVCADLDTAKNARGCSSVGAFPLACVAALLLGARRRRRRLTDVAAASVAVVCVVVVCGAPRSRADTTPPNLAPGTPFPASSTTIPKNARIVFFGLPHAGIRFERPDTGAVLSFTEEHAASADVVSDDMFIVEPGELVSGGGCSSSRAARPASRRTTRSSGTSSTSSTMSRPRSCSAPSQGRACPRPRPSMLSA